MIWFLFFKILKRKCWPCCKTHIVFEIFFITIFSLRFLRYKQKCITQSYIFAMFSIAEDNILVTRLYNSNLSFVKCFLNYFFIVSSSFFILILVIADFLLTIVMIVFLQLMSFYSFFGILYLFYLNTHWKYSGKLACIGWTHV